jgi:hypothetical protein
VTVVKKYPGYHIIPNIIYLFTFANKGRVTTTAYANLTVGPNLPNPPRQLSLWEETGVPGENPQFSAEH